MTKNTRSPENAEKQDKTPLKVGIARSGFEPLSRDPESPMIDHYTTGLKDKLYLLN